MIFSDGITYWCIIIYFLVLTKGVVMKEGNLVVIAFLLMVFVVSLSGELNLLQLELELAFDLMLEDY